MSGCGRSYLQAVLALVAQVGGDGVDAVAPGGALGVGARLGEVRLRQVRGVALRGRALLVTCRIYYLQPRSITL